MVRLVGEVALPEQTGCTVPGAHTQPGVCVWGGEISPQNGPIAHNIPHFTFDFCIMSFQEDRLYFQIHKGFYQGPWF